MTDLGTLGGGFAFGFGINPRGQVVGFRSGPIGGAYLWEKGVVTDLGTLPGGRTSGARAINPAGQVVGASETAAHESHATLWTRK
jgi:probable HAF family extracellular repeat protein